MNSISLKAQVNTSQFMLVDMQVQLAVAMPQENMAAVVKNCGTLLQSARLLNVPIIITEQYPKGLGHTLAELSAQSVGIQPIEKKAFSCVQEPRFKRQLTGDHPQIILAGMEAHICIVQTALDLRAIGKQVFIVEDAVVSRNPANKANALARMRDAGCIVTNTESVMFEWLAVAEGDVFKALVKLIR
ncbi:MAG: hydrolase [Betaproteobacteria bacterium]|nr:hydrolase [Betaproteobacteria bacterium]